MFQILLHILEIALGVVLGVAFVQLCKPPNFVLKLIFRVGFASILTVAVMSAYYLGAGYSSAHPMKAHARLDFVLAAGCLFAMVLGTAYKEGWPAEPPPEPLTRFQQFREKFVMWVIWYPSFLVGAVGALAVLALFLFKAVSWVFS